MIKNEFRNSQHFLERMSPLYQNALAIEVVGHQGSEGLLGLAGGTDYGEAFMLRLNIGEEKLEHGYLRQIVDPMWTELEKFDYRRLSDFARKPAATGVMLP